MLVDAQDQASPGAAAVPPQYEGFVDERSPSHLAGWVWNKADPAERVAYEVVETTAAGSRVLVRGVADAFGRGLVSIGVGDGRHAFVVFLLQPVAEAAQLSVRMQDADVTLPIAPLCTGRFEPVGHVAMDIVDNCNLRCPFCLYDYTGVRTTRFMDDATFESALRLLPYVTAGNFWLSCLHEPTLHPALLGFVDRVPPHYRDRIMYTTNLARRMPDAYFEQLAGSGLYNINISVESFEPELYERLRKGARFRIFMENWAKLVAACRTGANPPRLRYNMMAYRSNLAELPDLVERLLAEGCTYQVEIRYTFDEAHIPAAFKQAEYLEAAEWDWLAAQLAHHDPARVLLMRPPPAEVEAPPPSGLATTNVKPSYPLGMRIEHDGKLYLYSQAVGPDGRPQHTNHVVTNVKDIEEPADLIGQLLASMG